MVGGIVEAVRVVAIDARHRAQVVIEQAVGACAGARLVSQAARGSDGIEACLRYAPHIVVLHLSLIHI